MFGILDSLLKRIPGNGWKTELGLLVAVASELILPGQTLAKQLGEVLLTLGVFHKAIKKIKKK